MSDVALDKCFDSGVVTREPKCTKKYCPSSEAESVSSLTELISLLPEGTHMIRWVVDTLPLDPEADGKIHFSLPASHENSH